MTVRILSVKGLYHLLEAAPARERAAAIICTAYDVWEEPLAGLPVLHLRFDDTTDASRPTAFQPGQALEVRNFVRRIWRGTATLYVCCDAGESRSAAIGAAILRMFGQSDDAIWRSPCFHPNPLVYRLQCEAMGIRRQSRRMS